MLFNLKRKWVFYISTFFFFVGILFLVSAQNRQDFFSYFLPFTLTFIAYLLLLFSKNEVPAEKYISISIIAFCIPLFFTPSLSNDYYRFLWDGELFWHKLNCYDQTPFTLMNHSPVFEGNYMSELYNGMGNLSQHNYSCYPPLNQFYFILSTAFSDSVYWNIFFLKTSIVVTEIFGLYYLLKLTALAGIHFKNVFILFLNPLYILEAISNVHFEGVMITFLILSFYFLLTKTNSLAGLFFSLAIQIKLIPLILLPFFLRFVGWKRSLFLYLIIGATVVLSSLFLLNSSNINHFGSSLYLYFKLFEFNSSILYLLLYFDPLNINWFKVQFYAAYLSTISFILILFIALSKRINSPNQFFNRMTIAFFVYLLLSTTLHPWYILPLLFLSVLSNYSFPLLWSFTVIFSYSFYTDGNIATSNWLIWIEYLPVVVLFLYEMIQGGLFHKFKLNQAISSEIQQ
jgi:hypothetical protein